MALTEAFPSFPQTPQIEADPTAFEQQSASTVPGILHRPRRLRQTETLRRMVRETVLQVEDLIYPLFVIEGQGQRVDIGFERFSLQRIWLSLRRVIDVNELMTTTNTDVILLTWFSVILTDISRATFRAPYENSP